MQQVWHGILSEAGLVRHLIVLYERFLILRMRFRARLCLVVAVDEGLACKRSLSAGMES